MLPICLGKTDMINLHARPFGLCASCCRTDNTKCPEESHPDIYLDLTEQITGEMFFFLMAGKNNKDPHLFCLVVSAAAVYTAALQHGGLSSSHKRDVEMRASSDGDLWPFPQTVR